MGRFGLSWGPLSTKTPILCKFLKKNITFVISKKCLFSVEVHVYISLITNCALVETPMGVSLSKILSSGFVLAHSQRNSIQNCFDQCSQVGKKQQNFHKISNFCDPLCTWIATIRSLLYTSWDVTWTSKSFPKRKFRKMEVVYF